MNNKIKSSKKEKVQKKNSTVKLRLSNQKSAQKIVRKKEKEDVVKHKKQKNKVKKQKPETLKEKIEYKKYLKAKFKEFNENGKLTIVFFCDTFYPIVDGVIKVMDNYMLRICKTCNVVACVPKHNGRTPVSDSYVVVGAGSIFIKGINYDFALPELDSDFQNILKYLRIDIIHSHSPFYMGGYAIKLAKKNKIPVVTTFHSQFKQDFYQATKSEGLSKILLSNIMRRFDDSTEVWTMTNKTLATLQSYGFKGKYLLMPNATDMCYPQNPQQLLDLVNEHYGLLPDENILLFVGRIVEQKNVLFIVDTLKIAKEKGFKFKMFFVGSGPAEKKLADKILECNMQNEIFLTGKIMDNNLFQGMYLRADLFVFPSLYDASSIVQIEAAANKTPAIFIKDSVTSGNVIDNVNGFLCENDVEKFADRMIEIFSDKQKLKEVSEQCYKDNYVTWDAIIEKAIERYKYLIEENKKKVLIKKAFKGLKHKSTISKKINRIQKRSQPKQKKNKTSPKKASKKAVKDVDI